MKSGELNLALLRNTGAHGVKFPSCSPARTRAVFRLTGYALGRGILRLQEDRDWRLIPRMPCSITRTQLQRANAGWRRPLAALIQASDFFTRIQRIATAWPLT